MGGNMNDKELSTETAEAENILMEMIEYHKEVLERIEETKASLESLKSLSRQCEKEIMQKRREIYCDPLL